MTCDFGQCADIIMDYVEGSLQPSTRKKFEAHYFNCDDCFKKLQEMEQIVWLMRRRGKTIFGENPPITLP